MTSNHVDMPAETEWMMELARETGRPVLFNLQQIDQAPDLWKSLVARLDTARAEGVPLIGSIPGRPAGVLYGWRASSHPFHFHAAWRETAALPIEQRIARMRNPAVRARLLAEDPPVQRARALHAARVRQDVPRRPVGAGLRARAHRARGCDRRGDRPQPLEVSTTG